MITLNWKPLLLAVSAAGLVQVPAQAVKVGGDAQSATVGQSLAQPLQSSPSSQMPSLSQAGQLLQPVVTKASQVELQARVPPPVQPKSAQV